MVRSNLALVVTVLFVTGACNGEPSPREAVRTEQEPSVVATDSDDPDCLQRLNTERRRAARAVVSGIENNVVLLRRLFGAALQGKRRIMVAGERVSVEGTFDLAMGVITETGGELEKALSSRC